MAQLHDIPLDYNVVGGPTRVEAEVQLAVRNHIRLEVQRYDGAIHEWISIQVVKTGFAWEEDKLMFRGSCLLHGQTYKVNGWYAPAADKKKGEVRF